MAGSVHPDRSGLLSSVIARLVMTPNGGAKRSSLVRGLAACEEAASAEGEDVAQCNHDNINISIG